jgi:hypothetical protein
MSEGYCGHRDTPPPVEHCTCGIYASSVPLKQYEYGGIQGEVELWGKIIEHETGYRAQFARVVSLFMPKRAKWSCRRDIRKVADLYGVPIRSSRELDRACWESWVNA